MFGRLPASSTFLRVESVAWFLHGPGPETCRLQHPHILPLLDSGEAGTLLYYAMPLPGLGGFVSMVLEVGKDL